MSAAIYSRIGPHPPAYFLRDRSGILVQRSCVAYHRRRRGERGVAHQYVGPRLRHRHQADPCVARRRDRINAPIMPFALCRPRGSEATEGPAPKLISAGPTLTLRTTNTTPSVRATLAPRAP